jgi:very-short-patch-repair endonuclease
MFNLNKESKWSKEFRKRWSIKKKKYCKNHPELMEKHGKKHSQMLKEHPEIMEKSIKKRIQTYEKHPEILVNMKNKRMQTLKAHPEIRKKMSKSRKKYLNQIGIKEKISITTKNVFKAHPELKLFGDKNPMKRPEIRKKASESLKAIHKLHPEIGRKISESKIKTFRLHPESKMFGDKNPMKRPEVRKKQNKTHKQTLKENPEIINKIKEARAKQVLPMKDSSIEVKIQNYLKELKIEFYTHKFINIQHGYQCDILIPNMNMVIECDGNYWHKYPIGTEKDHLRTQELKEKGFAVLRLWEHEIKKMNIDEFKEKIKGEMPRCGI